jgi:hypothetical protein
VVRFAARAQQPAALNDVIEATTSEFGTKRTLRARLRMSVVERIVLQNFQNGVRLIFREKTKQNADVDRCGLERAIDVPSKFVTG